MTTQASRPAQEDYRARLVDALRTIERLQTRLHQADTEPRPLDEPVAVIGLGCRLPGGADTPEEFWQLLRNGTDTTSEFPADRGDAAALYDPDPDTPGRAYTIRGAFLDRVDRFEPEAFGITPREARGMDPQQRILLEVAWQALERAGYAPDALSGSATGVYAGVSTTDYARLRQSEGDIEDVDAYQLVGEPSFAAGRISYTLGLQGPCKVIDTTCSSSLVALHEACQALRLGECDMALAGGVNLMLSPYGFVMMSKFRGLSPDGRCATFDASANGYARGEGAVMVVLKRYADAVRDGDPIAAVVRGSAVNHDGRSSGLTVPNPAAQQRVIQAALEHAGVRPGDVEYVEAHGTGTSLGDPIELRALEAVIGRHRPAGSPLLVGSVKTNIGHLESAAGAAGLLKLVLAVQHAEIPPHLHFTEPNPEAGWDRLHIEVTADGRPWPQTDRPRIGAVSSFGASGTNAHAVISSPPAPQTPPGAGPEHPAQDGPGVLVLSAHSEAALGDIAAAHARHLRRTPELTAADACWTSQVGRARQAHALAVVGESADELADALDAHVRGARDPRVLTTALPVHKYRKTAWLFTGQGAQYAGMARELADEPAFRTAFDECAALFDAQGIGDGRPLASVVWPGDDGDTPLDDTRWTQPALFAVEYALARMWQSWGVTPTALLGHSIGEIAAACVAGVFGLPDAVRLVAARASLMAGLPAGGAMAAVLCDEETARAALARHSGTVALAAVNGPRSLTLSGAEADLEAVLAALAEQGVRSRRLTVSHAFHSPLLAPMLDAFREVAASLTYQPPAIPLYSNVTGALWTADELGPDYWVRHAASAVRFHDGLRALHASGVRTFLEIGPAPVLLGLGKAALEDPDAVWLPSVRRPGKGSGPGDRLTVRQALGALHLRGAQVDWRAVHAGTRPRRVPLPPTVWRGEPYWFPQPGATAGAAASTAGAATGGDATTGSATAAPAATGTEVPGAGLRLPGAVPTYEVRLDDSRWDRYTRTGHDGRRYLPLGALADVTKTAATDAAGGRWSCLEDLDITERIPMEDEGRVLHVTFSPHPEDGHVSFAWHSLSPTEEAAGAPWREHARGMLRRRRTGRRHTPPPVTGLQTERYGEPVSYESSSLSAALVGAVTGAHRGGGGVLVALAPQQGDEEIQPLVEVLDAAVAALSWDAAPDRPGNPAGFGLRLADAACDVPERVRYVRATAHHHAESANGTGTGTITGEVEFFAEDGSVIGGIRELTVMDPAASGPGAAPWRHPGELLLRVEWDRTGAPAGPADLSGESVLLLPDRTGTADALAAELRRRGAHCLVAGADEARADRRAAAALLDRWRAETDPAVPGRIVLLTGLDAPRAGEAAPATLTAFRDRTELAAVALVQELLERPECARTPLALVTRGTVPAGGGTADGAGAPVVTEPFGHTLWGLGRVIALEHPDHWGGNVDLDPSPAGDRAAEARDLLAALWDAPGEDQQALRSDGRYVARVRRRGLAPQELRRTPPVHPDGSYLITGAFGGIGQAVAHWLADHGAGRLVLLGRTPLPPRQNWDLPGHAPAVRERIAAVRALEATGVRVEVVAADVCDADQLHAVLDHVPTPEHPLRGIVHAAGVSEPQFLRDIPVTAPRDYDAVWRPKVVGGWLLHRLTEHLRLDFFLGFSSIAATWGSQHLTSYSAANAFLDGLAEYRRSRGDAALTVSWGPWELASNLFGEDVLAFLTSTGLRTLSAPQCLKLLGALLAGDDPQAVVCAADWSRYKPVMEARLERPMLRELDPDDDADAADGADGAGSPLLTELAAAPPEQRTARLVGVLREVLGEIVSVDPERIDPHADVMSHGLDSLMVMDVVKRCKQELRVSLRPSALFERSTLEEWAELLAGEVGPAAAGDDAGQAPAPAAPEAPFTDPARIAEDVTLDPAIRPRGPLREGYTDPQHVLLTGATGFVGAYLLDELLATTSATVHCLVRCADEAEGLARIRANAERYLAWRPDADARIAVVPGDLEKPLLGLDAGRFDALGERLDAIYHNGARVNFSYTYEQLRAANLTGCAEILRLACTGPLTPVSHVSTYGIWGLPADGRTVIAEDDDIAGAGKLVTGYVQTKWAAERLMDLARERGIPVDVHRPGRVLGDSRTGACLTTHFTTRVIKGCLQLGLAPALDLEVEMTPVDYVASALVRVSRSPHTFGRTYHLINRAKLGFPELLAAMSGYGWRFATVPVERWWQALQDAYGERDNELHPVMEVVEEFIVGGEEAIDYSAAHTEAALDGTAITCPALDADLLRTYFDWMVAGGYLPAPAPATP
ncbi:thioester reductase domain-containing protein [Streptomyces sp. TRM 70351]|uniref:thioester reductase domain-containing protein n=1 Tax=Streptomyces sp. TRM 70351 TaxID=3116552 RepID=UPI002E7C1DF4|nr:thioester reductase domain-containing protein [Streptomyces sp. TRM 70351]MEE1931085.1 thioester reductase domain-containing protein [Streptomyces sp. TRM 70351]